MKVLFIYIDANSSSGYSIGLGIASISAYLKKHNIETDLIYFKNQNDFSYAISKMIHFKPDIVGFYSTCVAYTAVINLSKELRKHFPDVFQVYGGPHAIINPNMINELDTLDAVCVGSGEVPTLELCRALESGNLDSGINGLWLRRTDQEKQIIKSLPWDALDSCDEFMNFDYSIFLNELEKRSDFRKEDYWLEFIFNRGCPYQCAFCSNHKINEMMKRRIFHPSVEASIEAVKRGLEQTKLNRIVIHDDIFTLNKKGFRNFIKRYASEIAVPFVCNLRLDCFDEEDIILLKKANVQTVWVGIESGNEYIRNGIMNKILKNEQIDHGFEILKKHNINIITQNIIGIPNETPEYFLDTIRTNAKLPSAGAVLSVFFPYKGTVLYDYCNENGFMINVKENFKERTESVLDIPSFPKEKIDYLYKNFYKLLCYEIARLSGKYPNLEALEEHNIEEVVHIVESKKLDFKYENIMERIEKISNHRFTAS